MVRSSEFLDPTGTGNPNIARGIIDARNVREIVDKEEARGYCSAKRREQQWL
jgi:hypothetical protein